MNASDMSGYIYQLPAGSIVSALLRSVASVSAGAIIPI